MNKELYYVIDVELEELGDGGFEVTNKSIDLYQIVDGKPDKIDTILVEFSDNCEEAIDEYLMDIADELFDGEEKLYRLKRL